MESIRVRRLSLSARLVLALGSVLLPFVAAASLGVFYLLPALVAPLEEIIGEVIQELEPLRHAQFALLAAGMAAQRRSPAADGDLAHVRQRVERAFDAVRAAPFADASERVLTQAAWREWNQASSPHVAARGSDGDQTTAAQFAFHAERAAALLDEVYVPARLEMERARAGARGAKTRSVAVTFAAFLGAFLVSLYAAVRIARPVIADIGALQQGAGRLAGGELSYRVAALSTDELSGLAAAFNTMAERIENDQKALSELATRDGLTGLLNRREFLRLLRDELDRSRRYGHSCALLMVDVDRFKTVNDTWGHPAGDVVLRAIAERVLNEVRPTDRVARYGGEEFVVLLPETGTAGAAAIAERIRATIAAVPIVVAADRAIPVTASIGLAAFPATATDEESFFASADGALYAAKHGGRDRVIVASP